MIDALLYAVRDSIRAAGFNYGVAECEIMDDGKPPPRAGNFFVAVHGGNSTPGAANSRNLDELFGFSVTLTARVTIPLDRLGDQMIARNLALVPLAQRQGFDAKLEQLRKLLHMNWRDTVQYGVPGRLSNSANDNIALWATGEVYGFCEPARYRGEEWPVLVGADWMGGNPEDLDFAIKSEMKFTGARRFQPQTASVGVFV